MCCGDLLSLRWWCPQLENMEELSAEVNKVRALAAEKDREINRLRVRAVPHNLPAVPACRVFCRDAWCRVFVLGVTGSMALTACSREEISRCVVTVGCCMRLCDAVVWGCVQEALGLTESKLTAAVKAKHAALQTVDDLTKQLGQQREQQEQQQQQLLLVRSETSESKSIDGIEDPGNGRDLVAELVLVRILLAVPAVIAALSLSSAASSLALCQQ